MINKSLINSLLYIPVAIAKESDSFRFPRRRPKNAALSMFGSGHSRRVPLAITMRGRKGGCRGSRRAAAVHHTQSRLFWQHVVRHSDTWLKENHRLVGQASLNDALQWDFPFHAVTVQCGCLFDICQTENHSVLIVHSASPYFTYHSWFLNRGHQTMFQFLVEIINTAFLVFFRFILGQFKKIGRHFSWISPTVFSFVERQP